MYVQEGENKRGEGWVGDVEADGADVGMYGL